MVKTRGPISVVAKFFLGDNIFSGHVFEIKRNVFTTKTWFTTFCMVFFFRPIRSNNYEESASVSES